MAKRRMIAGMPFEQWRKELLVTGKIAQGDEDEEKSDRYLELLDAVTGDEGQDVFRAILDSVRAKADCGIYERTYTALWKFPEEKIGAWFVAALPGFLARMRRIKAGHQVGRMLCGITNREPALRSFKSALAHAPPKDRKTILDWIAEEEADGWFSKYKGVLGRSAE